MSKADRASAELEAPVAGLHRLDDLLGRDPAEVGVGRGEVRMAELELNLIDGDPFPGQLGSVGVAKRVIVRPLLEASLPS